MSEKETKNQLQLERAKDILLGLKENITATDRDQAAISLELATVTIDRYLTGHVKKLDTATRLIKFFKEKIQEREKELTH